MPPIESCSSARARESQPVSVACLRAGTPQGVAQGHGLQWCDSCGSSDGTLTDHAAATRTAAGHFPVHGAEASHEGSQYRRNGEGNAESADSRPMLQALRKPETRSPHCASRMTAGDLAAGALIALLLLGLFAWAHFGGAS